VGEVGEGFGRLGQRRLHTATIGIG
jgi:hypothetical protein